MNNHLPPISVGYTFQPTGTLAKPLLNPLRNNPLSSSPIVTLGADDFKLRPPHPVSVLRSGVRSPNFQDKPTEADANPWLRVFDHKIENLTAESTGLDAAGFTTKPHGWNSFWYGADKNATNIRSKFMGCLRSHDWLNNALPTIQNMKDKSTEEGDRFTFSTGTITAPTIQGEPLEVQTPRFCFPKARSSDGVFRVSLIGDPGYNTATLHYNLAAMKALPETLGYNEGGDYQWDALLSMGDNLYGEKDEAQSSKAPKNQSGHPDHFWNNIGNAYNDFFADDIPFFTALGNHEVKGGHQDKFLKYVDLPPYYRMSFGGNDQGDGACVEVFVINMTGFRSSEAVKLQDKQGNSVVDSETETKEQNAWLLSELANSMKTNPKAKRLIVGHYPIFQQDNVVDMPFAKDFRHTVGLIYQQLLAEEITVDGEKPTPLDVWLNGHVHKFTVNESTQLSTAEGEVFDLPSPLTQWSAGCTAHAEMLGKNEQWTETQATAQNQWAEPSLALDKMQVRCQNVGTGFSLMEIDPKHPEKPVTLGFIEPPMQPHKVENKEEEGTYWWGQLVETGAMNKQEAHVDNYKSVYSIQV
jgi:Calcineurin-like phosphoesterase